MTMIFHVYGVYIPMSALKEFYFSEGIHELTLVFLDGKIKKCKLSEEHFWKIKNKIDETAL